MMTASAMTTAKPPSLPQWLEYLQQLAMHEFIAADQMPGLQRVVIAGHARDHAACFADHDLAGCHVPGLQIAFPVAVEAAGGDEGHVEGGGAEAAEACNLVLEGGHLLARQFMIAAADMGQTAGDHAFVELAASGDAQPLIIEERALAALGDVELVIGGIVDHTGDDGALALQADRDRELRDAVQEVGGTVQGIDDPG